MNEYRTRAFALDIDESEIDDWLNKFTAPGIGTSVVGYVCSPSAIYITVKRWKLADRTSAPPGDSSQPDTWKEPTINLND